MKNRGPGQRGYSLIELLVVIAIAAILSVAAVQYIGSRPAAGVRQLLDELEGALADVQKQAIATGRDTTLATAGSWTVGDPLRLVRADSTLTGPQFTAVLDAARTHAAWKVFKDNTALPGGWTVQQYTSAELAFVVGTTVTTDGGAPVAFTREYMNAQVAPDLATWNSAIGSTDDINSVPPFAGTAGFTGTLSDANRLFTGAQNTTLSISGTNKRFNQTFWIPVVPLRSGIVMPGDAMGLLFVQANGGTIYKFYNPGRKNGDGKWRRI